MRKVHYFSFYLTKGFEQQRIAPFSAYQKVEYLKKVIVESGEKLVFISTARAKIGAGFLRSNDFGQYFKSKFLLYSYLKIGVA